MGRPIEACKDFRYSRSVTYKLASAPLQFSDSSPTLARQNALDLAKHIELREYAADSLLPAGRRLPSSELDTTQLLLSRRDRLIGLLALLKRAKL